VRWPRPEPERPEPLLPHEEGGPLRLPPPDVSGVSTSSGVPAEPEEEVGVDGAGWVGVGGLGVLGVAAGGVPGLTVPAGVELTGTWVGPGEGGAAGLGSGAGGAGAGLATGAEGSEAGLCGAETATP
jgi:hypothetical protein